MIFVNYIKDFIFPKGAKLVLYVDWVASQSSTPWCLKVQQKKIMLPLLCSQLPFGSLKSFKRHWMSLQLWCYRHTLWSRRQFDVFVRDIKPWFQSSRQKYLKSSTWYVKCNTGRDSHLISSIHRHKRQIGLIYRKPTSCYLSYFKTCWLNLVVNTFVQFSFHLSCEMLKLSKKENMAQYWYRTQQPYENLHEAMLSRISHVFDGNTELDNLSVME